MKCITLLLDGASDRSYAELDGKTPLAYAHTPNLDKIAADSQCGLLTGLGEGLSLGTDLAHMLLFGYQLDEYPNRSVIDAIGEQVDVGPHDLLLRASVATVEKRDGYWLENRFTPQLTDGEIEEMIPDLNWEADGVRFRFVHSYDSHGFVILSGRGLSDHVSDSDPFHSPQYVMAVEPFEAKGKDAPARTATLINRYIKFTHEQLSGHPVNQRRREAGQQAGNLILTKWAGRMQSVEAFARRNGMEGCLIGQSKLLQGVAQFVGMDYESYATFGEGLYKALESKADYVHLHTKDPDTAAHKKSPKLKVEALEAIDRELEPLLAFDGLLVVTSDHSTPCAGSMIHSGESNAFMARGAYIRQDQVSAFHEVACAGGSARLTARDLMNYVINATDRGALYHLRQGGVKRNYVVRAVNKLL